MKYVCESRDDYSEIFDATSMLLVSQSIYKFISFYERREMTLRPFLSNYDLLVAYSRSIDALEIKLALSFLSSK